VVGAMSGRYYLIRALNGSVSHATNGYQRVFAVVAVCGTGIPRAEALDSDLQGPAGLDDVPHCKRCQKVLHFNGVEWPTEPWRPR
jgi:hypothetical protein